MKRMIDALRHHPCIVMWVPLLEGWAQHDPRRIVALVRKPGLSAAVYTQTTDVETESNGLLTYDRAVIKVDLERVAAANRGDFSRVPVLRTLVPSSQKTAQVWRYTLEDPGKDWFKPDFDA